MQDKYKMTQENNILFAKRNLVDCIYKEAKLEGIGVTFPDTHEIIDGRSVAGLSVDDIVKVNNLKHAWQFILDTIDYPMDLRYLRQINSEIGSSIVYDAGNLRTASVEIGGTTWRPDIPDYDNCKDTVDGICRSNQCYTEKSIDLMLFTMRSQMFMDGNKRTAQIAANQMMIQNGCGLIAIPEERQAHFISLLISYYETNNSMEIKNFLYDECIIGIDSRKIDREKIKEEAAEQPTINKADFYKGPNRPQSIIEKIDELKDLVDFRKSQYQKLLSKTTNLGFDER